MAAATKVLLDSPMETSSSTSLDLHEISHLAMEAPPATEVSMEVWM